MKILSNLPVPASTGRFPSHNHYEQSFRRQQANCFSLPSTKSYKRGRYTDRLSKMTILGLAPSLYPKAPAHFDIEQVIRPNILSLHPYRCARDDYSEGILLDANENALGHSILHADGAAHPDAPALEPELQPTLSLDLHRYPSPRNDPIRERLASMRGLPGPEYVFLGVGSDEVIDLLMRVCVAPGREKILTTPPTYGMYAVCAQVNDVGIVKVPLELSGELGEGGECGRFSLKVDEV